MSELWISGLVITTLWPAAHFHENQPASSVWDAVENSHSVGTERSSDNSLAATKEDDCWWSDKDILRVQPREVLLSCLPLILFFITSFLQRMFSQKQTLMSSCVYIQIQIRNVKTNFTSRTTLWFSVVWTGENPFSLSVKKFDCILKLYLTIRRRAISCLSFSTW